MAEQNNVPFKSEKVKDFDTLITVFGNLDKSSDKGTALSYAINAQLQLLKAIDSKTLSLGLFNLMIESLNQALKICNDENQKDFLQEKACLMIASFISFKDAKWRYEAREDKEEVEKTLKQACEMLVDTAGAILSAYTGNVDLLLMSGQELYKTISKDKSFLGKFLDIITGKAAEKAFKKEKDHYSFLQSAFEKIYKYQPLFGKSSVLAELAQDYKNDIIEWYKPFPPECTSGIKGISIGVGISELVLFVVLGIMALVNLIPKVDWSRGITIMWYVIGGLFALGVATIVIRLFIGLIQLIVYKIKCSKIENVLDGYYDKITEVFDIV